MTEDELAVFSRLIAGFAALPADDSARLRAERVAESFARESRRARQRERRADRSAADAELSAATALGAAGRREDAPMSADSASSVGEFHKPRRCYVCKEPYSAGPCLLPLAVPEPAPPRTTLRRTASTDLAGRRALLTGGRVKIGFQLALMLLRDGAHVTVTSRFPADTVRRFTEHPGSADWSGRLSVVGIDLRDPHQVLGLCDSLLAQGRPLDILINNAAQTVRRPPESYAALLAAERVALPGGPAPIALAPGFQVPAPRAAIGAGLALVGAGSDAAELDEAGLLPDPAPDNSWSARLGELDPAEILETHLVNAYAPALLCDRLLPLLRASAYKNRYIVNVTAVEGRFEVRNKTGGHPHTNMAKAALNMLTRTAAADLATEGIHLCAVDTGWITDENPAPKKSRLAESGFRTPLDIVDGAARVYDPIVRGEAGRPVSGVFLKDYREAAW
jgi:NAD(P)-dependent dehydrogenase (short-subunit alcohol dehydrogenase family)